MDLRTSYAVSGNMVIYERGWKVNSMGCSDTVVVFSFEKVSQQRSKT